jgi:hypothetical protein
MGEVKLPAKHEYAGFRYVIDIGGAGNVRAVPEEGQHQAAWKEKHRRAAVETFFQEQKGR